MTHVKKYFGTDGIRGEVGIFPFSIQGAQVLGYALGIAYRARGARAILMGRDTRGSGSALSLAVQSGLMLAGLNVQDAGVLTTPGLAYAIGAESLDGAVVITASHNPYSDNGIKCFDDNGLKLSQSFEADVERSLEEWRAKDLPHRDVVSWGEQMIGATPQKSYKLFCQELFPRLFKKPFQSHSPILRQGPILDLANGAANAIVPDVLSDACFPIRYLGQDITPASINAGCGSTHPEALQEKVLCEGASFGAAFDGDGDRLILVDEKGQLIGGDAILYLMVLWAERQKIPVHGVVGTILTNLGLEQALLAKGLPLRRTPVGDRWILEALKSESDWWLGGENSGHVINLRLSPTGDGLLNLLCVLDLMLDAEQSLSELLSPLRLYPQYSCQIPWADLSHTSWEDVCPQDVLEEIDALQNQMAMQGRLIIRPSGTEPVLRLMIECADLDHAQQMGGKLKTLLEGVLV